eukprot:TRINITY_DN77385_c0_g1_i1.p1 TRINITY_DN77385_c0_g1~~TRINITY_DN77385_c0_g1_i1.p1  ORF type:complete len:456 (-),score=81.37 TRINITY_DN77385_c0_g1_i1:66-1358(-)
MIDVSGCWSGFFVAARRQAGLHDLQKQEDNTEGQGKAAIENALLRVMTMAGHPIMDLPIIEKELVSELQQRIHRAVGTAASSLALLQAGRLLRGAEEVLPETVFLVRKHRQLAVAVFANDTIVFWDLVSGERLRQFAGHSCGIKCVAADWESMLCFTGEGDGRVRVWDIASGKCTMTFDGFTDCVSNLCLDAAGKKLLAVDTSGAVRLCNFLDDALSGPIFHTGHAAKFIYVSCDWSRNVVFMMSHGKHRQSPSAYDFCSGGLLWSLRYVSEVRGLEVDWESRTVLLNSRRRLHLMTLSEECNQAELRTVGDSLQHEEVEHMHVNWRQQRVLVLVKDPCSWEFVLELWELRGANSPLRRIEGIRIREVLSFDVDWRRLEIKATISGIGAARGSHRFVHLWIGAQASEFVEVDRDKAGKMLALPVAITVKP